MGSIRQEVTRQCEEESEETDVDQWLAIAIAMLALSPWSSKAGGGEGGRWPESNFLRKLSSWREI